jgi:hypothetical protein
MKHRIVLAAVLAIVPLIGLTACGGKSEMTQQVCDDLAAGHSVEYAATYLYANNHPIPFGSRDDAITYAVRAAREC